MFREEREEFRFDWSMLGDLDAGRTHLGPTTTVAMYRLMQYTLRDSLIRHTNVETADRVFFDAGAVAGKAIYDNLLDNPADVAELIARLQAVLRSLNVGILRVEKSNLDTREFVLTVAEDLDCSGLPLMDEAICTFDEGLIAGILERHLGIPFHVKEVDCWGTGDRVCRFEAQPR